MRIGSLHVEATPGIVALFPGVVPHGGKLTLEHTPRTTIPLRAMGFDAPASVALNYDWCGGRPFDIQVRTVESMTERSEEHTSELQSPC